MTSTQERNVNLGRSISCPFFPTTGTEEEWNAAYCRVEDYLGALHLNNKVRQSQIILEVLHAAAKKHAQDPTRSPTTLVMEEADASLEMWFTRLLPESERPQVMGCVALLITNGAEKWPMDFLVPDIPAAFQKAIQENNVRAGPDLQVSRMIPRSIDVPLVDDLLKDSMKETQNGMMLVALIAIIAVFALIALLYKY